MATRKKSSSRGRSKKKNSVLLDNTKLIIRKVISVLTNPRTHRICGLALCLFAVFLLLAFISYLNTWSIDHSEVKDAPWYFLFFSHAESSNIIGRLGSVFSHLFIYRWFGLAAFIWVGVLFLTGLKWIYKNSPILLARIYQYAFLGTILLATILGFLSSGSTSGFPFGGGFGSYVSNWLISFIGILGTGLFLLFCLAVVLIAMFDIEIAYLEQKYQRFANHKWVKPIFRFFTFEKNPTANSTATSTKTQTNSKTRSINPTLAPMNEDEVLLTANGKQIEMSFDANSQTLLKDKRKKDSLDQSDLSLDIVAVDGVEEKPTKTSKSKLDTGVVVPLPELEENDTVENEEYDPTLDLGEYKLPSVELLEYYGQDLYEADRIEVSMEELEANKEQIVQTLNNYNIEISKIKATPGPTVTLYEIVPAPGVRISRIRNLEDDIALSLAALGIRIIAPMPGKGTVGIEVPNRKKEIVSLRSILESEQFQKTKMELPIALGRTISNENYIADLSKMPHLLMAGATGQGKSVCLNSILVSLLYRKHPAELKFVMIDPKKVELSLFNTIEMHYLAKLPGAEEAIVTDTKQVVQTLNALCIEMDQRYDLLKNAHVRNIKEYNRKFKQRKLNPLKGHRFLPYFVLVIDEFADLIMTAGKEIEMPIARLAQLARAIGIHLVIATQRPTVNIITGTIKANFPVRIAFRVTSKVDSRTILDMGGANQLIGRGDMLVSYGGDVIRLQGTFVDTPEVDNITEFIGKQRGYPSPFLLPEYSDDDDKRGGADDMEMDELFEEAAHIIVQHQQGSTSLLQRRLKLGYNRAGRIMDQLEAMGIVGPNVGSKAREVYFPDSFELEQYLQNMSEKK
ncbi:MAG: DNA translocase FtsK 4TM domain-containing protein [Chitinophagales bacterium]